MARSEGHLQRIIRHVQIFFSDSDTAQPGVLGTGKAADPTTRATLTGEKNFLRDPLEGEDIIVVPERLLKRS